MPYVLPHFSQVAEVFAPGLPPSTNPPVFVDVPVAVYYQSRTGYASQKSSSHFDDRVPEIRVDPAWYLVNSVPQSSPLVGLIFGIPDPIFPSVTWYYICTYWDYYHAGFANCYPFFVCDQCDDTGTTPDSTR